MESVTSGRAQINAGVWGREGTERLQHKSVCFVQKPYRRRPVQAQGTILSAVVPLRANKQTNKTSRSPRLPY